MNWVYGDQIGIPKWSCCPWFPLYLSLGWRGGAGGEVSEIIGLERWGWRGSK